MHSFMFLTNESPEPESQETRNFNRFLGDSASTRSSRDCARIRETCVPFVSL